MQTDEKLKKRIAYEKMLAGISEQAVSVDNLDDFLSASLKSMGGILDVSRIFFCLHLRMGGQGHRLLGSTG